VSTIECLYSEMYGVWILFDIAKLLENTVIQSAFVCDFFQGFVAMFTDVQDSSKLLTWRIIVQLQNYFQY